MIGWSDRSNDHRSTLRELPGVALASPDDEPLPAELHKGQRLAAAADGDQRSWEILVGHYGHLVWTVARSFRLDRADAADVSQTTWLKLVEHLRDIREPHRLGSWLVTTARREA